MAAGAALTPPAVVPRRAPTAGQLVAGLKEVVVVGSVAVVEPIELRAPAELVAAERVQRVVVVVVAAAAERVAH